MSFPLPLPRTLLWRVFLLVAALIVLSVFAWFQIFRVSEREPRAHQATQLVASVVNLTRAALITAQPDKRRALLAELAEREGIRIYPAETSERISPPPETPWAHLVEDGLRHELGPRTRVAFERNGINAFWVSFHIDDDEYWVMLPRNRVERQQALQWLWWGALALGLALAGAYLIVAGVSRPLRQLAKTAIRLGRGEHPDPLPERGPEDIQVVARAFNRMSNDLARLDQDRALILAGVSHDLRTPLARMRLGIELGVDDAPLKQGMTADIEEMDRILGQFLDFARSDGGEALQPTDLAKMAQELAAHYKGLGRTLDADLAPLPALALRPLAFRRMIANLVDNALHHAGEPVSLATRVEGETAIIEVADRGPGIPESEIERLKRPFTRLESARTDGGGAGLGLAIVDRVARLHGARFDLLPREGGGLIARISVPFRPSSTPPR